MSNPDDGSGDAPDTFDGRLTGIARLIDTLGDETSMGRRRKLRAAILRLLAELQFDAAAKIDTLRDRIGP